MRVIIAFVTILNLWLPNMVAAQSVVVELFTSQGCSSCPPADKVIRKLAQEDDVIVLGWHVDYWDYLGWKDEFSRPENTARQMGYRDRWKLRSLYTPQAVIHGEVQIVGSDERQIRKYVGQFQADGAGLDLKLNRTENTAGIQVSANVSGFPAAEIYLVKIIPEASTRIQRGENAGKTIHYVNIVEEMVWVANWNGRSKVSVSAPINGDASYVVLVQAKDFGPILGAGVLN
jgi:hypothetical protein